MDLTIGFAIMSVIYGVLFFFDSFFKTCMHYPYVKFMEGTGLEVQFFCVKWRTKAFNRTLIRWGNSRPYFLKLWFTLGMYVGLLFLPISIFLLIYGVFQNFKSTDSEKKIIEPVIPGVNLPASELGYYSLTLVVCSIIHEIGHALAGVLYDVNLVDIGVNVFFIMPLAYVNLSTEKFSSIGFIKTLQVLCAGIWHNLIFSLVAYLLYLSLPSIFSLFYNINAGVTINHIMKNSPLIGQRGLNVGDTIFKINDCIVRDENSWYSCLSESSKYKTAFCLEPNLIHNLDESVPLKHLENGNIYCCDEKKTENICLEYLDMSDGVLEMPSHVCLPGRTTVEETRKFCSQSPHSCPSNMYCFRPVLTNITNLFKITCENKNVIYTGLSSDIYSTIEVSSYIPRNFMKTTLLPDVITKLVKYIIIFSFGLAILNVLPCIYFDGQYILEILSYVLLKQHFGENTSKLATAVISLFSTFLLIGCCLYSLFDALC